MYVCVCVCVCLRVCVRSVRECVRVVSRATLIFPSIRMRVRKWAGTAKGKYV